MNERRTESQRFEMTFGHIIELHKPPKAALSKHGVPAWIFRLGTDLVMLIHPGIILSTFISSFIANDSQNTEMFIDFDQSISRHECVQFIFMVFFVNLSAGVIINMNTLCILCKVLFAHVH